MDYHDLVQRLMRLFLFLILSSLMLVQPFLTRYFGKKLLLPIRFATRLKTTMTTTQFDDPEAPRKFVPFPFKYHEEVDVVIDDLTNLGFGVGRKTLPDGSSWVIMVPTVLPGEEVRVKVYRNFANYSDAELVNVTKESPDRVKPLCKYFNECGGCQYQHMNIDAQRKWKRSQVVDGLQRIGGFVGDNTLHVNEIVASDKLYGYRSKLTPHYGVPRGDTLPIGFQKRNTKTLVDIDDCIIASDNIRKSYILKREEIKKKPRTALGATLLFREGDNGVVVTEPRSTVTDTVEGVTFQHKASEFFQNNPSMLGALVQHVVSKAAAGPGMTNLIDTYCGSGLFALCAASNFSAVYGVEISNSATEAARNNAQRNNIHNARFLCAESDVIFSKTRHLNPDHTVVIIDPPRKGCDELFLKQLYAFRPKRVVYVSCDPSTQARDAKGIVNQGGYRVSDVTPFDLFPQTRHIENVMVFDRD